MRGSNVKQAVHWAITDINYVEKQKKQLSGEKGAGKGKGMVVSARKGARIRYKAIFAEDLRCRGCRRAPTANKTSGMQKLSTWPKGKSWETDEGCVPVPELR